MIAKKYRLREYEVTRVFKKGRPSFGAFWTLNFLEVKNGRNHRMAVSVSRKHDKRAVARNRYRRGLYDAMLPFLKVVDCQSPRPLVPLSRGENSKNESGGLVLGGRNREYKGGLGYFTYPANSDLKSFSHQMSRQMTRAEQRLWFEVLENKKTDCKWVKQKIIGNYIVDFYCHEKRLVIEVDGGVHTESQGYDQKRTQYLEELGIQVIRFTNDLVLGQTDEVRKMIMNELAKRESGNTDEASPQVPLSRGVDSQNEDGGLAMGGENKTTQGSLQQDQSQNPNHQLKISSPLKGALGLVTKYQIPNTKSYLCVFTLKKGLKLTEKKIPDAWINDAQRLFERLMSTSTQRRV